MCEVNPSYLGYIIHCILYIFCVCKLAEYCMSSFLVMILNVDVVVVIRTMLPNLHPVVVDVDGPFGKSPSCSFFFSQQRGGGGRGGIDIFILC